MEPYHQKLYVSLGESEERFAQGIRSALPAECCDEIITAMTLDGAETNGLSWLSPISGSYLRMRKFPESPYDYGGLQHELFHAVELLFGIVRMPHHPDYSSEAWAYLIDSLTTQLYTFLRDV